MGTREWGWAKVVGYSVSRVGYMLRWESDEP